MPYLEHKLPDGTRLIEHYENDVVVGTTRIEQLPTGMTRSRRLDAAGTLVEEIHFYGTMLDFSVTTKYLDGRPAEETYFRKRRLITRSAYLKARAAFSDMPAPSEGLPDLAAEVGALVSWERRQKQAKARGHTANPERATRLDEFCRQLLSKGVVEDLGEWILAARATLGERDRRSSRNIVRGIYRNGAARAWACDIQTYSAGVFGTSHLVVQLPEDVLSRVRLLAFLAGLARQQGFDGDPDDGQKFGYLKLD
jgi:hypothetical protein